MKRKKYLKPCATVVNLNSELMAPTFVTCSVGNVKFDGEQKQFMSDERFQIINDMKYSTETERKFWDDWDNGAD